MKKRTLFIIPLLILMMVVIAGFLLSVDFLSSGNIQRQKENTGVGYPEGYYRLFMPITVITPRIYLFLKR